MSKVLFDIQIGKIFKNFPYFLAQYFVSVVLLCLVLFTVEFAQVVSF